MWIIFDKIEERNDLVSKAGKNYTGFILSGTKKGFEGTADEPYEKVFFDTQTATVIEKGVSRPGKSIVQFFQKACKAGDMLVIRNEKDGKNWRIVSIENISGKKPSYEPLPEDYEVEEAVQPTEAKPPFFGDKGDDAPF